ncbi:MAG: pyrimidine-nucleoside phosphorylase [Lachnospiraceae bacterium]|nr:pyrimidine-nucleoside phosphorylase [Lachnospiraceae bacterium]
MRMYDCILAKKMGRELNRDEIEYIINGFTDGTIPDYQMSAFLMAVCLKGMTKEETLALTMAMAKSGDMLDLSPIAGNNADNHSTGGVGDKTTLIVGPIVAALGVPVAKMSGRGLGHTGGTIDKLESFPGFVTELSEQDFFSQVNRVKFAVMAQTANLAPADKKIYALRDVTATVDSIPLIASSIMSKKLAAGADVIVLDVKAGSGAFMKTQEDAILLAKTMVEIGNGAGRKTCAVVTDMSQPLGYNVGNILEVKEAIKALQGEGSKDLMDASFTLAAKMLTGAGRAESFKEAYTLAQGAVADGSAFEKFCEFIRAQGGDDSYAKDTGKFTRAEMEVEVRAVREGYVRRMQTEEIGMVSLLLGAGRQTKESIVDLSAGICMHVKSGDYVAAGDVLATLHTNRPFGVEEAHKRMLGAVEIGEEPLEKTEHVLAVIHSDGQGQEAGRI